MKGKLKTLKVLERFLKTENILLKERNQILVSENDKLKESQAQLQDEHELVLHQAFMCNKSRKELKKQNKKLQVQVQIYKKKRTQPIKARQLVNVEILLSVAQTL